MKNNKNSEIKNRHDELLNRVTTGLYLEEIRRDKNLTLSYMGEQIGVSATYVSDIEKGRKVPSDTLIRKFAKIYSIGENNLFEMYNKIPLSALEFLKENDEFRNVISNLNTNPSITKDMKNKFIMDFVTRYNKIIDGINKNNL